MRKGCMQQNTALVICGQGTSDSCQEWRYLMISGGPDDVVAALEARAARLGLSRSEFLRRRLAQEVAAHATSVSGDDLVAFAETFADLADPEVMKGAWE
jgi:hypothetical protein